MTERLAIAGSGAIACGLAAVAARHGPVVLVARSRESADRAQESILKLCDRLDGEVDAANVEVVDERERLHDATFVVEAIVEDREVKSQLLAHLSQRLADDAVLATTTSSLSVADLAVASGRPERFVGFHVFNPVTRMELVELAFPQSATPDTRRRALALCEQFDKTPVEVPDTPGFVVNRLLFPYLFSAVTLMDQTGLKAADIDTCMRLGAGHPMGPLALLDLVGLDVAIAIGETIGTPIPARLRELVAAGALGRKSGRGLHDY